MSLEILVAPNIGKLILNFSHKNQHEVLPIEQKWQRCLLVQIVRPSQCPIDSVKNNIYIYITYQTEILQREKKVQLWVLKE